MYKHNDGSDAVNALQNQFTVYLAHSVQNAKKQYLHRRARLVQREQSADSCFFLGLEQETDTTAALEETDELLAALKSIKDRERYVFLSRVLEEKGFDEIAAELGISYKGAAAVYYRTVAKLRERLGGTEG